MSKLDDLRLQIRKFETAGHAVTASLPFGIDAIDKHLPGGGLKLGSFHEVSGGGSDVNHSAAAALFIAGILARTQGQVLWCVKQRDLFAPALAQVGLDMERVVFAETGDEKTLLACFEEGLRHPGISGVVGEVSKLSTIASRRLQLAAESSGAIGFALWRPFRGSTGWMENSIARTRWRVTALPAPPLPVAGVPRGRWQVELICSLGGDPVTLTMEACDETGTLALPADLADRRVVAQAGQLRAIS